MPAAPDSQSGPYAKPLLGVAIADISGRLVHVDTRFAELLGYSVEELYETTFATLTHPEDRPRNMELIQQLLDGEGAGFAIVKRYLRRDGTPIWVRNTVTLVRDDRGRPSRIVASIEDVEDTVRERSLLAGQTAVLHSLATGTPLPELLDQTARFIERHSNGMLASILILDDDGRHLRHGAAPSLPTAYNTAIDGVEVGEAAGSCGTAAARGAQVFVQDIRTDPLWVDYRDLAEAHDLRACWSTPIRSTSGELLGTFALYYREPRLPEPSDLELIRLAIHLAGLAIERAQGDERLKRLNEELERRVTDRTQALAAANAELESFSYTVAHDLRAPLRGVRALAQYSLEDYGDTLDEEGRSRLRSIITSCDRMKDLIQDVLNLSLTGRGGADATEVDLTAMVCSVAEDIRRRAVDHGVSLDVQEGMKMTADPRLMRIALENLLGNAWKFTRGTPQPRVEVTLRRQGEQDVMTVRDNGAGFDPRQAARLFQAFQRLHTGAQFEGTGIGLATVRRIVERHGGRVWAEGEPGRGAAFHLALPSPRDRSRGAPRGGRGTP